MRFLKKTTTIDFLSLSRRRVALSISAILIIASLVSLGMRGLNFGIDFLGGTTIRTESSQPVDVGAYRQAIAPLDLGEVGRVNYDDLAFAARHDVVAPDGHPDVGLHAVTRFERPYVRVASDPGDLDDDARRRQRGCLHPRTRRPGSPRRVVRILLDGPVRGDGRGLR